MSKIEDEIDDKVKPFQAPASLNEKHQEVIRNVLSGMGKAKAYQLVYPDCKSPKSAHVAWQRIIKNPQAKSYYDSEKTQLDRYVNKNNFMSLDVVARNFQFVLAESKAIVNRAKAENNVDDTIKGLKLYKDSLMDFCKTFGRGTFDPTLKLKIQQELNSIAKQREELKKEAEKNNVKFEDDDFIEVAPADDVLSRLLADEL